MTFYIDDIVQSMIRGAEIPDVGVMNVGSGEARSFTQIVSDLEYALGLKGDVIAPTPAGHFASTLANNTRMKSKLGIQTRTLREGLKAYLRVVERTT